MMLEKRLFTKLLLLHRILVMVCYFGHSLPFNVVSFINNGTLPMDPPVCPASLFLTRLSILHF